MTTIRTDAPSSGDESADAEAGSARGERPSRSSVRTRTAVWLLARRVHFMAGLLVGPFLAVLALSGLAYAFTPQLNDALYGDELFVASVAGQSRPVSEQVEAALAAHPDGELTSVVLPVEADRTTQVVLSVPGLSGGDRFSGESLTVYVDPYTSAVTGALVTVNNRPPAQVWLRELHGNLHLGEPGRLYSEFVASWLPFLIAGGLVLWMVRSRRSRALRALLLPTKTTTGTTTGRARTRSWHGALGLWLALGLLALSVTGLTWSTYAGERVDVVVEALDATAPRLDAPPVAARAAPPITVDRAVEVARREGLAGTVTVHPPTTADEPFTVAESGEGLPIRKASVAIDPYSAQVTARQDWQDYPLPAKLTTLGIAAHSGTLFGLANQIVLALLAAGAVVLLVLGYRLWWKRRPIRGGLPAPPPPVWRRLPVRAVVLLVAGGLVLGWLMPVFGVTLAGFLAADAALGAFLTRRRLRAARRQ